MGEIFLARHCVGKAHDPYGWKQQRQLHTTLEARASIKYCVVNIGDRKSSVNSFDSDCDLQHESETQFFYEIERVNELRVDHFLQSL